MEQAFQDMSTLFIHIMVNSVKCTLTLKQATLCFICCHPNVCCVQCEAPSPAADARIADDSHCGSPLGLDGTKGLSEVGYQSVAGAQIQQAETCPHLSKRSTDSSLQAIQGIPTKWGWVCAPLEKATRDFSLTGLGPCVTTGDKRWTASLVLSCLVLSCTEAVITNTVPGD